MKSRTVFFLTMFVAWAAIAIAQTPEGPPDHRARRSSGTKEQSPFENPPRAKDEAEAKVLKAMEEIQQTQGWRLNVPMSDGRLLRLMAEAIDAKSVIEIGTSNGISSIWIAMAVRRPAESSSRTKSIPRLPHWLVRTLPRPALLTS